MTKNKQLLKRVEKDMQEIENEYCAKTPLEIFNNAYGIATFCEFADAICFACEDDDEYTYFDNIDKLINCNGNLIKKLSDIWREFPHPEHYSFFSSYDAVFDIINVITSWENWDK